MTDYTLPSGVSGAGLTAAQQEQQCAQRAAQARTSGHYSCTVVTKKQQTRSKKSVSQLKSDSLREVSSRIPRFAAEPAAIAPACSSGFYNPDRFTSCSTENWTVTATETVDGVTTTVGEMDVTFTSSVEFDEGSGTPSWDLDTDLSVPAAWGTLETGITGSMWTGCSGHPDKCTTSQLEGSNGENEPITLGEGAFVSKWYTQYSGDMLNNQVLYLTGNLGSAIELNTPGNPVTLADHESNTLFGRCDSMSNRYGQGCGDDTGWPFVLYSTPDNPAVGPVAQHVFDAMHNLPSHWGSPVNGVPLNRLTNQTQIDQNRSVACGSVVTPTGYSCDEHPLASTYQGGNGAAPNDRSTAVVPQSANNSQGGLTGAYYDYYRILDDDPFYVQAVLADGTTAW
ncbi:hypothetical protein [Amycolatopsis sp. FDAARGOS 1241]|uniref:NucA/NucB deoxyribonuclease domain-containing protein n=1 Tax=Amycolatopsis sp. FDAARGOS 1241 TaxID=2778070 RepID=UPI00194DC155|nr:hypothetical protein [Amycolatopsis sp. FDAARGOS 1241]QRP47933.1 hypothetical protein I6J71_08550 [Amycolatopsis sp. FDAARGOS 1241]